MDNIIKNPNILTSWLYRADILSDSDGKESPVAQIQPEAPAFEGLLLRRHITLTLVPRNEKRDSPMNQTCLFYESIPGKDQFKSLVVCLPHLPSNGRLPFYHPGVDGYAILHQWDPIAATGSISIHYLLLQGDTLSEGLKKVAFNILSIVYKHGRGSLSNYEKRVHHDALVPQARLQNRYAGLKRKYARDLLTGWLLPTDASKHVFEDLGIAAFLIELWHDMYRTEQFPGFVDIGCGNGLLVYILNQEGYGGWGFDARARKSWKQYCVSHEANGAAVAAQAPLRELVLVPHALVEGQGVAGMSLPADAIHDGRFAKGTFLISNHADQLTPWTPLLAAASECPFLVIPCCSHSLSGERRRAPLAKSNNNSGSSAYASLVEWVATLSEDCGWVVEREALRIPSTRNKALLGRERSQDFSATNVKAVIINHGGAVGYVENVLALMKAEPSSH
jgi:tRNASer (uridine44-2'-O)-methyltransferase